MSRTGFLDCLITTACALHDLRGTGRLMNSREGLPSGLASCHRHILASHSQCAVPAVFQPSNACNGLLHALHAHFARLCLHRKAQAARAGGGPAESGEKTVSACIVHPELLSELYGPPP